MISRKLMRVNKEAERYNTDVEGIAEHIWVGQGCFRPEESFTLLAIFKTISHLDPVKKKRLSAGLCFLSALNK